MSTKKHTNKNESFVETSPQKNHNIQESNLTNTPSPDLFKKFPTQSGEHKKGPSTKITIKYDVGFSNALFLRGKGANLSWDKGVVLKNIKNDEWVWETNAPFTTCEFKVLLNDKDYEIGENHFLSCGASIYYTPKF